MQPVRTPSQCTRTGMRADSRHAASSARLLRPLSPGPGTSFYISVNVAAVHALATATRRASTGPRTSSYMLELWSTASHTLADAGRMRSPARRRVYSTPEADHRSSRHKIPRTHRQYTNTYITCPLLIRPRSGGCKSYMFPPVRALARPGALP